MLKTIFYFETTDSDIKEVDYTNYHWFDGTPYKYWLEIDGLYDPNGNIITYKKNNDNKLSKIIIRKVKDIFTEDGIIRKIALNSIRH